MPNIRSVALSTPDPLEAQRIASEEEINRQRELAMQFARQAGQTQRIENPLQGINYVAQNVLSGVFDKRADKAERTRRDAMAQALTGALGDTSQFGIPEESLRQIMAIDPQIGSQLLSAKMEKAMNPPERWEPTELNGIPGQRSTVSGKFDPFPQSSADMTKVVPKDSRVFDAKTNTWITPPAGSLPPEAPDFKDVSSLRKEVQDLPTYKSYKQAEPIFATMVDAVMRDSKAADLNLVYGLGKIFDPNSVVREGELILVKDTSALPDWVVGEINSLNGGARLQPDTRLAIVREAQSRMEAYKRSFESDLEQFQGITERYNIPPEDAIPAVGEIPALPDLSQFNQGAAPVGDPPPPGIDPEDWKVLTPEERALWRQ